MKNTLLGIIGFLTFILPGQSQILYGTTYGGGYNGGGTINKFIPATNNLTVLKSFESLAGKSILYKFYPGKRWKALWYDSTGGNQ